MKNDDPFHTSLDETLTAFFSAPATEQPSPDFRQRCRAAAFGALDVLKMQQYRPQVAGSPGSLLEHFQTVAHLADVRLESIFCALSVNDAEAPDAASSRGLALLARHLGLARDEAMLRLRWGFTRLAGSVLPVGWPALPVPARGRQPAHTELNTSNIEKTLHQCESGYSPAHRSKLRAAINCFAQVYEQEMH